MATEVEQMIDAQIASADAVLEQPSRPLTKGEPVYKVGFDTRVPVSKAQGKLWRQRIRGAEKNREARGVKAAWDESVAYYNNNQSGGHPDPNAQATAGRQKAQYIDTSVFAETENVVYSNIAAMVPHIYAKNPSIEITPNDAENEEIKALAKSAEKLAHALAIRVAAPGINLKPKAKRATVNSLLTNSGWLQIGYTKKELSAEQAFADLQDLSEKLEKAKTPQEIQALEGKIRGLEEAVYVLEPAGPWCKFRRPNQVVIDPHAEQDDGCDGRWMAVYEFMDTALLNAVYGEEKKGKDKDGNEGTRLRYKPSHILRSSVENEAGHDGDDIFASIDDGHGEEDHKKYGFDSHDEFTAAQRTKVWYVFDKTTRRIFLYADNDWTWPIWVWDDPLMLDQFFPLYRLVFHTSPVPGDSKGEVTYILDQQDAINEINHEQRLARTWARKNVFFNKRKISETDVAAVLSGPSGTAKGIDVPDGLSLKDLIFSMTPPSIEYPQLFDKSDKYQAIDRILSSNDVMRGGQFKTNTTNKAIEQYAGIQAGRLDEFVDALEDFLGHVLWGVVQLCLQHMDQETVTQLIGARGAAWRNLTREEILSSFSVQVAGGSSAKPTSRAKKEEAIQIGQVLGQFAGAAPMAIVVAIRVMQRAFDEVVMTDEDWQMIIDSITGAVGGGEEGPSNGAAPGGEGGGASTEVLNQVMQMIDSLPPEAKKALGDALASGVPVQEAISQIMSIVEQEQMVAEQAGAGAPQPQ